MRGDLVKAGPDLLLVVSGGMFNQFPDEPGVVVVPVIKHGPGPLTVRIGKAGHAVPGWITSIVKTGVTETVGRCTQQELSDVNNTLFKILSTE